MPDLVSQILLEYSFIYSFQLPDMIIKHKNERILTAYTSNIPRVMHSTVLIGYISFTDLNKRQATSWFNLHFLIRKKLTITTH